ncbi:MAG: glycosyltransferase [Anaerolineae bacterium]|nr:MAG: glycosyltransferase [Anaerolineae bacterium]
MHRQIDSSFGGPARREALRPLSNRLVREGAIQLSYAQANQFDVAYAGHKIGFTMLEVDGLSADWVEMCNRMDGVFTPSHFNENTFANSGVRCPITVMPLGIDPDMFNPSVPGRRIEGYFTFLSVFEWGERKAPEILLKAFNSEFKANEKVLLLLKVDNRDPSVNVQQQVADFGLSSDRAPIGFLYNQPIANIQMGALYRSADCFVLPTRGEGWGMPILEAMACGLPVIATNWSAQTEFMNQGNAYPLCVRQLIPAQAKCPYYKGFHWADPDYEHLRYLMRYVFEHQDKAREKGHQAAKEVAHKWTWQQAATRLKAKLLMIGTETGKG